MPGLFCVGRGLGGSGCGSPGLDGLGCGSPGLDAPGFHRVVPGTRRTPGVWATRAGLWRGCGLRAIESRDFRPLCGAASKTAAIDDYFGSQLPLIGRQSTGGRCYSDFLRKKGWKERIAR